MNNNGGKRLQMALEASSGAGKERERGQYLPSRRTEKPRRCE